MNGWQWTHTHTHTDDVKFYVYGKELERVKEFWYLGRILREDDDDMKSVESQIQRA